MFDKPRTGADLVRAVTVVLVDEEPMMRTILAQTLTDAGLDVVARAADGEAAIELVVDLRPDVVVMGIRLPVITGVQATETLGLLAPASRVLILTDTERNQVVEAIIAGASGYILKTAPTEQIVAAVKATAAGQSVLSPQIAGKLLQHIRDHNLPTTTGHTAASAIRAALTERELQIFTQLASGKSNQDIANELSLSTNTISNHITSILHKLQLENRVQAAVQAVRAGIS
jgi:DNA-binding NarL/FixJ family response regulator